MRFKVLVPSYKCEEWIVRCMESIKDQTYDGFDVLVIDDASPTDENRKLIKSFVDEAGANWSYLFQEVNQKCPANIYFGIDAMEPKSEDVIVIVDGDDFLPHQHCLTRIAEAYENPNVWLTYGNYEPYPENTGQVPAEAYSQDEINRRDFRSRILFNHPLTFKHFLWEYVPLSRLMYSSGEWLDVGYDRAIMFPLMEMAGDRFEFIDEPLYAYNAVNPLSDVHVRLRAAQKVHRYLATTPKMERLPNAARYE